MKKFRFRLERLHEYRTRIRDERKRELMQQAARLQEAKDALAAHERSWESAQLGDGAIVRSEELILNGAYLYRLKEQIDQQRLEIIRQEEENLRAMERYLEASKEEKVLATLREHKFAEYQAECSRQETIELDEVAMRSEARKRRARQLEAETAMPNQQVK